MGRRNWNPADHPRDGQGRFSHSASGWAGKVGDKIAATRGDRQSQVNEDQMDQAIADIREQRRIDSGTPTADEINRDTYNWDIFEKLDSVYAINEDSGNSDDHLGDIINDLETALKGGDRERASALADEGRHHALANGYVTDGELPSEPAPGMSPAERVRQQRDDFNRKILDEAQAFQAENIGDQSGFDDFEDPDIYDSSAQDDPELQKLIDDLISVSPLPGGLVSTSIPRRTPVDHDRADRLADELRRYLVANGYADDDELPSYKKPSWAETANTRLPGGSSAAKPLPESMVAAANGYSATEMGRKSTEILQSLVATSGVSEAKKDMARRELRSRGI